MRKRFKYEDLNTYEDHQYNDGSLMAAYDVSDDGIHIGMVGKDWHPNQVEVGGLPVLKWGFTHIDGRTSYGHTTRDKAVREVMSPAQTPRQVSLARAALDLSMTADEVWAWLTTGDEALTEHEADGWLGVEA